jgi:hypothetical protein
MVLCVPAEPDFTTAAERDVWGAVKRKLRQDDALLANVRLTDERGDFELDLVVGLPGAGIAVVEVKGGHVAHDGEGWIQTGTKTKRIDPVRQARDGKYVLRDYLDCDPRWRRRIRLAHLVAFPYSRIVPGFALPDCPRWMVIDRGQLDDVAGLIWDAIHAQDTATRPADPADIADLVEILGGRMLPQRDLLAEVAERERQVDLLTERQAVILGALQLLARVEMRGGSGTGKTWLAVEQARRLAAHGKRVALTCFNRGLASYLERRAAQLKPSHRPAYVGTFHRLGVQWGAPSGTSFDQDYWEERLPAAMMDLARALPVDQRFDALVIDEAQDFADSWWPPLLSSLKDEETGEMYVFADEGQHVYERYGRPPVPMVPIVLDENLRNTVPIARTFGSLAPIRMRYRGGAGPPVKYVPCTPDEAVGIADDEAVALLEAGWAPEHIALLTTGHRHPEQVARQERGADAYWSSFWEGDDIFYGHALGFKGLERPAVVLAVNGFREPERAKEVLYVALSRARDLLIVCGDLEMIREAGGDAVAKRLIENT